MKIVIPVTRENKFRFYLHFMNPIIKCTKREIDVLAILMSLHYTNRDRLSGELKNLILAADTRKLLAKHLKMTIYQYNNIIHALKKKGLIVDGQLNPKLTDFEGNSLMIEVIFKEDNGTNK